MGNFIPLQSSEGLFLIPPRRSRSPRRMRSRSPRRRRPEPGVHLHLSLTDSQMDKLTSTYVWPGRLRELAHKIRALLTPPPASHQRTAVLSQRRTAVQKQPMAMMLGLPSCSTIGQPRMTCLIILSLLILSPFFPFEVQCRLLPLLRRMDKPPAHLPAITCVAEASMTATRTRMATQARHLSRHPR